MTKLKYQSVKNYLKENIQQGNYRVGDFLPSENELCKKFGITRTTAQKALDELLKQGFIEKQHGKGSRVIERRKTLGLLSVKGFSEAVGEDVRTVFLQKSVKTNWNLEIKLPVKKDHLNSECLFFERLRYVGDMPVMHESNWFPAKALPGFLQLEFVEGSFFKTLSTNYFIEITGSTSELRAEFAGKRDEE